MRRTPHGFTLLEVLVAIGLVGFSLLSLLTLLPVGLRSTGLASDVTAAAFLGQEELSRSRANATVLDVHDATGQAESSFDLAGGDRDNDGFGYFDLPFTVKKGRITNFRVSNPSAIVDQTIRIAFTSGGTTAAFNITGLTKAGGALVPGTGSVGTQYTSTDGQISFLIEDNASPPFDDGVNDTFLTNELIEIRLVTIENAWYAYWASRYDYSEDREFPELGIPVDGIPSGVDVNKAVPTGFPNPTDDEDTGLDLVPNFWEVNGIIGFQSGIDRPGETGYDGVTLTDPHGDDAPNNPGLGDALTGRATEGNGQIDAFPDAEIQRVTVRVVWREGGTDREERFSAYVANQFR